MKLITKIRSNEGLLPSAHVLLIGAPGERQAAQAVIDAVPKSDRTVIFGEEDLLTVQACLQRSALYIGNDSGLMHMAAAAGIHTLGLFGPSRPENYAPYGMNTAFVCTDRNYDELVSDGIDWHSQDCLMGSLSVSKVFNAACKLLLQSGHKTVERM